MSAEKASPISTFQKRVNAEIQDNLDEDIELELEDDELADLLSETEHLPLHDSLPRQVYFKELLRLQRELIKLQDWVVAKKLKLVVLFEGRDSAGKGGAIKRVTQRLNPRVCRAVALPAPTERESTQWYFQRYVPHLPAGGEIVLFDRSWYNRAGVERVMGFCTDEQYEDFFQSVPEFERLLVRSGIVLVKYWFSITDDEQHLRFLMRINDPLKQWKLSPMDLEFAPSLGTLHQGQGDDARTHSYPRGAVVGGGSGRQETRPPQLHRPSPDPHPLRGSALRKTSPAQAGAQPRVPPQPRPPRHVRAGSLCRPRGRSGEVASPLDRFGFPWLARRPRRRPPPRGLDSLGSSGFSRPNRAFSMGCGGRSGEGFFVQGAAGSGAHDDGMKEWKLAS